MTVGTSAVTTRSVPQVWVLTAVGSACDVGVVGFVVLTTVSPLASNQE